MLYPTKLARTLSILLSILRLILTLYNTYKYVIVQCYSALALATRYLIFTSITRSPLVPI